jgi:hypothetical protein
MAVGRNSEALPDRVVALGMIGAWAQHEEKFFLDMVIASTDGTITMSVEQGQIFVEALNRIQNLLVAILNDD